MFKISAAMYAWGGPGTVRLLRTKYHHPHIDEASFLSIYDRDRLAQAKKTFGLSDVWTTFSWGFSDRTEQADYDFITRRLHHFHQLKLRAHAYVQGLSLVTSEFPDQDLWCRDGFGRTIPYSKGRSLVCPNNPAVRALISKRVKLACASDFAGVFIDNLIFGLPPTFLRQDFAPFFGCFCQHCRTLFAQQFGYEMPTNWNSQKTLDEYLEFRSRSIARLIHHLANIVHQHKKVFGVNLYDPVQIDTLAYMGFRVSDISTDLDYYLIENHFLPSKKQGNIHLRSMIQDAVRPLLVLSYERGIGAEPQYTQAQYNAIFTEAQQLGYVPCYKVSEFTTDRVWHTTDFSQLQPVSRTDVLSLSHRKSHHKKSKPFHQPGDQLRATISNRWAVFLMQRYFSWRWLHGLAWPLYQRQLRAWRNPVQ